MSTRIPLEALIRRCSRMAEQMFDRQGDVDPIWLVETAGGEQHVIVSPIIAPSALAASDYKDRLIEQMREKFAELGVVRYARASECWTVKNLVSKEMTQEQIGLRYAALGYTLQNHPDRQEVVLLEAADATELLQATRESRRTCYRDSAVAANCPTISAACS
jgi:hypothetical protein